MNGIKEAVASEMEACFNGDTRRINHAHKVTAYAEQILEEEKGDYTVVIAAALLHDIGIHQAEAKHGSTAGKFQETEGPPIARDILTRLAFGPAQIEEICQIIAHHHSPGKINSQNFKTVYDADWLVNLKDEYDITDRKKLAAIIDNVFLTETGKSIARAVHNP